MCSVFRPLSRRMSLCSSLCLSDQTFLPFWGLQRILWTCVDREGTCRVFRPPFSVHDCRCCFCDLGCYHVACYQQLLLQSQVDPLPYCQFKAGVKPSWNWRWWKSTRNRRTVAIFVIVSYFVNKHLISSQIVALNCLHQVLHAHKDGIQEYSLT